MTGQPIQMGQQVSWQTGQTIKTCLLSRTHILGIGLTCSPVCKTAVFRQRQVQMRHSYTAT